MSVLVIGGAGSIGFNLVIRIRCATHHEYDKTLLSLAPEAAIISYVPNSNIIHKKGDKTVSFARDNRHPLCSINPFIIRLLPHIPQNLYVASGFVHDLHFPMLETISDNGRRFDIKPQIYMG